VPGAQGDVPIFFDDGSWLVVVATLTVPARVPRFVGLYFVGAFTLLAEAERVAVSVDMVDMSR
jgi:hypothetical protein